MPVLTHSLTSPVPKRLQKRLSLALWALVLGATSPATFAIGRIVIEVGEITLPDAQGGGITATVDLGTRGSPSARVRVEQMDLPAPIGTLRDEIRFLAGKRGLVHDDVRAGELDAAQGADGCWQIHLLHTHARRR